MKIENYIKKQSDILNSKILKIIPFSKKNNSKLVDAIKYTINVGGKRLRPLFVMETSKIFNVPIEFAFRVATSIELIHCYSLVHDDLPAMDDDDLRRGHKTCHKKFDEATAILVGDALQSLSFEILSNKKTHPSPKVRSNLVNELSRCAYGMVEGQMLDLEAEKKSLNLKQIVNLQQLKTGELFRFACISGCILADEQKKYLQVFEKFAFNLGVAFQIKDDILDIEGDEKKLGKKTQKDLVRGKETFITIMGLEKSRAYSEKLINESIELISKFDKKSQKLKNICELIISRSF